MEADVDVKEHPATMPRQTGRSKEKKRKSGDRSDPEYGGRMPKDR